VRTPQITSCDEGNNVSTRQQAPSSHNGSAVTIPQLSETELSRDSLGAFSRAPLDDHTNQLSNSAPHNPASTSALFQVLAAATARSQPQQQGDEAMSNSPHIAATPHDPPLGPQAPHIDHIKPRSGPVAGGTEVTILGKNLRPELRCVFGGDWAIGTCFSDTAYECRSPPKQAPGQVEVGFEGVPNTQPAPKFTYEDTCEGEM
jgi:hypothetical protein